MEPQTTNQRTLEEEARDGTLVGVRLVSNEAYQQGPGISRTDITEFTKSPAHYKYWAENKNAKEPTDAMIEGSAFHDLVLEPDKFKERWTILEPRKHRKDKARELKFGTGVEIVAMGKAVWAHPTCRTLLTGLIEHSFYWIDKTTGLLCKCRVDCLNKDLRVLTDLKTTKDADPERKPGHAGFATSMLNHGYHVQAAWYLWGVAEALKQSGNKDIPVPEKFVFVPVEKAPPHFVSCCSIGALSLDLGTQIYRESLDQLHVCLKTDVWPGWGDKIHEIDLPGYALANERY